MLVFQLLPATLLAAATLLPSFSVASSANAGPLTPSSSLLDPSLVKHKPHQKRLLCQLTGLFCNFNTDENNCGSYGEFELGGMGRTAPHDRRITGYKCQTTWANGAGALCLNGICGAATCATGYAFNWSSRQCVNINNDVNNWCVRVTVAPTSFRATSQSSNSFSLSPNAAVLLAGSATTCLRFHTLAHLEAASPPLACRGTRP